jgi:drug/metabolite transporter (DMT)-like permease
LWTGLIGYFIWQETPTLATVIGGMIVVGSGLYLLWRETRRAPH